MKINALIKLCKNKGAFCLYDRVNDEGGITEQWLGARGTAYPLSGLPYLTEDNIIALFDITEKQREKIHISHGPLPESLSFEHTDDGEIMLDREIMTMGYGGRIVRPLITRNGLEFIDNDFLTPLADVADTLELFERQSSDGRTYFAAKMGLMVVGIFTPLSIIEEKLVENMETLAAKCRAALKEKIRRDAEDAGQIHIGEV